MAKLAPYKFSNPRLIRVAAPRPAPIVVNMPRAPMQKKQKHHRRRAGGSLEAHRTKFMIGALAIGLLEKNGTLDSLPTIPMLGKKGTAAIATYFLAKNGTGGDTMKIASLLLACLAAYEYGKSGSVSGEGVAAQW